MKCALDFGWTVLYYCSKLRPIDTQLNALSHRSHVTLAVYNTLGQEVATLVSGDIDAGYHTVKLDGSTLASGVYFCRMSVVPAAPREFVPTDGRDGQAGSFVDTKKLLLVR